MRRLLTGYVVTFNRRHRRHGQLFQNRYKSIICQEDIYLKELVRYIHLNPLRAKMVPIVTGLNRYKYCGHAVLTGRRKCIWQDEGYVLSYFGHSLSTGRKEYYSYVKEGMDRRYELKSLGYDLDKLEQRVLESYPIEREDLYSKSREKIRAEARGVFCYWAVRELGVAGARLPGDLR